MCRASCADPPQEIWRGYNRRADMENRIAELKHDLGADGFCLKQFFATEAAFRAVLLLFNLLAEFQRAVGLPVDTSASATSGATGWWASKECGTAPTSTAHSLGRLRDACAAKKLSRVIR